MKSFVVLTYYHLMHAVAMTLESKEKSNLFFIRGFYKVDDEIIENIKATGIFENVIGLDQMEFFSEFVERLAATKGMCEEEIDDIGSSIFDECLEPYYEKAFAIADKDDEIYVYNDFQRPYYYIAKHFSKIIGVEDGYCMLQRQLKAQRFAEQYEPINAFVGKYYPEVNFNNHDIKKIISSCDFDGLPKQIKEKLEVVDFKLLARKNIDQFRTAMISIFPIGDIKITDVDTLYLTAPMARSGYCNTLDDYLVSKKIIKDELLKNKSVLIKPHPADNTIDHDMLESKSIIVLSRHFPVELLEYVVSEKIDSSVSFFSSSLTSSICNNNRIIYDGNPDANDIKQSIKEFIKDERLIVNVYITANNCSIYNYVNILSWLEDSKKIRKNVKLLVPEEKEKEFRKYYNIENFKSNVDEFLSKEKEIPFFREIAKLSELDLKKADSSFSIHGIRHDEEELIFNEYIRKDECDYFILLDSYNQGSVISRNISGILRESVKWGYSFMNYTYLNDAEKAGKIFIGGMRTRECFYPSLTNLFLSKSIVNAIEDAGGYSPETVMAVLNDKASHIQFKERIHIHRDNRMFTSIEDGYTCYADFIKGVVEKGEDLNTSANQIAIAVYNYYNWKRINSDGVRNKDVFQFINDLEINIELKEQVYAKWIDILLLEKARVEKKKAYKQNEWYEYNISNLRKVKSCNNTNKNNQKHNLKRMIKRCFDRVNK